jgi:hypothetical protein
MQLENADRLDYDFQIFSEFKNLLKDISEK